MIICGGSADGSHALLDTNLYVLQLCTFFSLSLSSLFSLSPPQL